MKKQFVFLLISFMMSFLSPALYAQEKTQAYYNTHETEILPDAQEAFLNGNYVRAEELCRWHYIIVGDRAADEMRNKALRCIQLSEELHAHLNVEDLGAAKRVAEELLTLNQNDAEAMKVLAVNTSIQNDSEPVNQNEVEAEDEVEVELAEPSEPDDSQEMIEEMTIIDPDGSPEQQKIKSEINATRFAIKAGASILDFTSFVQTLAPGVSGGLYDIAGSRFGIELGAFFCPFWTSTESKSIMGIDASALIRVADGIYPKVYAGFFNCKKDNYNPTKGILVGAGVSFIVLKHLCLDFGLSFFPNVKLNGTEQVSISGLQYDYPSSSTEITAGLSPTLSIGWAF